MKRFIIISILIIILFVFISQCTSQKIVGHPYEVKGQYYDYNPIVPLIKQIDVNDAHAAAEIKIGGIHNFFFNYNDLNNQYNYQCFSLKNEGTTAHTIAQAAAAGTASREQLLNFYYTTKDAIQREENCQESISVFQNHQFGLFETRPSEQLYTKFNQNMQISVSDENAEMTNYNIIASNFNNAIISCRNSNQILGTDGMCHDICVAPNIYCK